MLVHARGALQPPEFGGASAPLLGGAPQLFDMMDVDSGAGEGPPPGAGKRHWSEPCDLQAEREEGEEARKRARQPAARLSIAAGAAQLLLPPPMLPPPQQQQHAPLQLPPSEHQQAHNQQEGRTASSPPCSQPGAPPPRQPEAQAPRAGRAPCTLSLLTYNTWGVRDDVYPEQRMAAISGTIADIEPDFVCLQEVSVKTYKLLSRAEWWDSYHASHCPQGLPPPQHSEDVRKVFNVLLWHRDRVQGASPWALDMRFENSMQGRELRTISATVCGRPVRVAVTHLESGLPARLDPEARDFRQERWEQCQQAAALLSAPWPQDVLLAGDMNWRDERDGPPPLPPGWVDAWLHPETNTRGDPGCTFWPMGNHLAMPPPPRLDRVFCRLQHWRPESMQLLNKGPLPPDEHGKTLRFQGCPLRASDHYALLLRLRLKDTG